MARSNRRQNWSRSVRSVLVNGAGTGIRYEKITTRIKGQTGWEIQAARKSGFRAVWSNLEDYVTGKVGDEEISGSGKGHSARLACAAGESSL